MTRATIVGGACATLLVLLALAAGYRAFNRYELPAAPPSPATAISDTPVATETHPASETDQGYLYGRITTAVGATYEGRLRWGGDEEAFWGDYFNGTKIENPWGTHLPPEALEGPRPIKLLGVTVAHRERRIHLDRPFMARFGDIARIEAHGEIVRVILKSGAVFDLDRFEASDFDDGLRVWDRKRGVVDLDSLGILTIEFLPTPSPGAASYRLHGTVRTPQGEFTGNIQWNRQDCVGSDTLDGRAAEGEPSLRFDTIRSIARRSHESSLVTLLDGRELVLSATREAGRGNLGVYVDDPRYGRVLVSWEAFERVDFTPAGSGPAYGDFPPGQPLTGSVTTRAGKRLAGRLVYDLDESETTETLDAPSEGVDYTIPFSLIATIVPPDRDEHAPRRASVTLHDGEELWLERSGDLGDRNAGLLIFVDGRERPDYVAWSEVERIDFDRPAVIDRLEPYGSG